MALSPEKNDVDITALFEYRKPVTIHGKDKSELEVYMRVVGDSEIQKARVKALRASRDLRNKLKDHSSDEYMAFIPDISEANKERLIELTLLANLRDISSSVAKEIEIPFPEEPDSEATLEEQENYQKLLDEYPKKREDTVRTEILKRASEAKEELSKKTKPEIEYEYMISLKDELCEIEMTREFYDYVVFYSLFKDKSYKTPLFESFEDYGKLPGDVKEFLLQEYRNLELGLDELKK